MLDYNRLLQGDISCFAVDLWKVRQTPMVDMDLLSFPFVDLL